MRKLEINNKHLTLEEIKIILNEQKEIRLFRYWQLLYYISTGKNVSAQDCSDRLAIGKYNIYRIVQLYNRTGKDFINHLQWGGRRKLSFECEVIIINKLLAAKNLDENSLTKAVKKEFGGNLPKNYITEIIKRHQLEFSRITRRKLPSKKIRAKTSAKKSAR